MARYELPRAAEIGGREYEIRSDYRAILDIISVMNDPDLDDQERALICLCIFYPDFDEMPQTDYQDAVNYMYWFIGGGEDQTQEKRPKLLDWDQDFPLIVGPVNRVMGKEIRDLEYLHWWSFLSAYYEIGECLFSQVVSIRAKKAKHKPLDKQDQEFYRRNKKLIDFDHHETEEEKSLLGEWYV